MNSGKIGQIGKISMWIWWSIFRVYSHGELRGNPKSTELEVISISFCDYKDQHGKQQ